MKVDRLIALRRPPRLLVHSGCWVPPESDLQAIDTAFALAQRENPRLHDSAIWHVLSHSRDGHGGVTLHVIESSYRFQAVARRLHPNMHRSVRPLGVKCLAHSQHGWLMGRRSPRSLTYGDAWEFLGGGSLAVGESPPDAARRELLEEAGVRSCTAPIAVALLFDATVGTWDIIHRVDVGHHTVHAVPSWEHSEIALEPNPSLRTPQSHATQLLLPIARATRDS